MNLKEYDPTVEQTLGHVELKVSDLKTSADFYQQTIGLRILEQTDNQTTFTVDGEQTILSLLEDKDAPKRPARTTGLFHLAILVPIKSDLAMVLVHLANSGYPLDGASDHIYSKALYLRDPDNNGIEIYVDEKPNKWKQDGKGGYITGTYGLDVQELLSNLTNEDWTGLPKDTKLGHMHFQVSDIKEAKKFYVDALGFDIKTEIEGALFVAKDNYHHHIGLNTWAGVGLPSPPRNALGLQHFTVHFTKQELAEAKSKLDAHGYRYEEKDGMVVIIDPSGNKLHLYGDK